MKKFCSVVVLILSSLVHADELLFKFKSPSFSGINSSSHYLTIENQENTRRGTIKQEREAELDAIEREENNSTLARFMRNFESRVYAQLSRQLVEQLFGENPSTEGKLELEGNLIEYVVAEETVTLTITDENNGQTTITIPVGDFTF
tara:strand:- start:12891 stop:13331 length:441 start_codon:yes stop_codon:yes gene_type:complete